MKESRGGRRKSVIKINRQMKKKKESFKKLNIKPSTERKLVKKKKKGIEITRNEETKTKKREEGRRGRQEQENKYSLL